MGTLKDKIDYLKGTRDLQQAYLKSQGKNVTNATPFRKFLDFFKELSPDLASNSKFVYDFDPATTKTFTIPKTAKQAVITLLTVFNVNDPNGTPSCTASKGTLTAKHTGSYQKDANVSKPYVWVLSNTTGSDSTITLKINWDGGASYGEICSFISVVY